MNRCFVLMALALLGCGSTPRVTRVYDGRVVEERYIAPEAYAAFLRGALAEESGDFRSAIDAYREAEDEDEVDPEIATRLGEVRCRVDPRDPEIDRAFARAMKRDPGSASALAAAGRCALSRGRAAEAAELARRAAELDPSNVTLIAFAARTRAVEGDPAGRAQVVALTEAHGEIAAAWDALLAWGYARKDALLVARGLAGLVRAAPTRSREVESGALALLRGGQPSLAGQVAVAVADAPRELGVLGPSDPTVARLAVDEALARGDASAALARATRGHVSLGEVAARALLLEKREIAFSVASSASAADPAVSGAVLVKAALAFAAPPSAKPMTAVVGPLTDRPPELCALVYADRLAMSSGADAARAWLTKTTRTPLTALDPLGGPLLRDLAARGVIDQPAARIE